MAENELGSLAQRVRDDEVAEFALMLVGAADPNAVVGAGESTLYWDRVNNVFYINNDGVTAWTLWPGGGGAAVPHQLLDNPWHTDTVTNTPPAAGSVIVSTAGFAWSETVHPGAAAQFLRANAAIPGWAAIAAGDLPNLGAMPALTYGVANAAGVAVTYIRTDATIDIFDAVVPGTIQCDDAAGVGVAVAAARRDHQHAIVNAVAVNIGVVNAEGVSTSFSRADHVHDHIAGLGVNLHHNEAHVVNSTGPHAEAGLTIGHVLRASGAAAFSFAALIAADLPAHTHSGAADGGSLVVGTTDTDAAPGSVFFAGAAGVIQQDNAGLFYDDTNDTLGVRSNAPHGSADALYAPWITGDTQTTAVFGSSNASNNQIAVEGFSYSNVGVQGTSEDEAGVKGFSTTDQGVQGQSASGDGGSFASATGQGLYVNLTGAGTRVAGFHDGGGLVVAVQDGGQLDVVEYIRHLGDTDTYLRFRTDNITLHAGGVDMIDIVEGATDYIALGGVELRIPDGFSIGITGNEVLTFNAAGTIAASGITGVSVESGDWVGIDSNTSLLFETDRVRCYAGSIEMWDAYERATDYLNLHAGLVGINVTANAKMTIGLTIDQAANDDEILNLRSDDVGRVYSNLVENGTWLTVQKMEGGSGGALFRGFKDDDGVPGGAMRLLGYLAENVDATKTNTSRAILELGGFQTDETTTENTVADGNVMALITRRGGGAKTVAIWDVDGDYYYEGALVPYDDENDALAAWDLSHVLAGQWNKIIEYGADKLEAMGVIGPADENGERMVSNKRMNALQLGAIGQGYFDRLDLRAEIEQLREQCQRYELALSNAGLLGA